MIVSENLSPIELLIFILAHVISAGTFVIAERAFGIRFDSFSFEPVSEAGSLQLERFPALRTDKERGLEHGVWSYTIYSAAHSAHVNP